MGRVLVGVFLLGAGVAGFVNAHRPVGTPVAVASLVLCLVGSAYGLTMVIQVVLSATGRTMTQGQLSCICLFAIEGVDAARVLRSGDLDPVRLAGDVVIMFATVAAVLTMAQGQKKGPV